MNFIILHKPEEAKKLNLESFDDFAKNDVTSIACTICNEFTGPSAGAFSKWLKSLARDSSDFERFDSGGGLIGLIQRFKQRRKALKQPDAPSEAPKGVNHAA